MLAQPIVVGIDGGPASMAALQVAMKEAALRQTEVRAIICWPADARADDSSPRSCDSHQRAAEILEHVIAEATHHDPRHVPIVREVSRSVAGSTLVAAARRAELLVLGSTDRGRDGRHGTRRIVEHCIRHSAAPVLVVPWTLAGWDERDIELDLPQSSVGR